MTPKPGKINLTQSLKELNDIVEWFAQQEDVDVEAGLVKVREATALIKDSKTRLAEVQNEFKEIEKEIGEEVVEEARGASESIDSPQNDVGVEDIPS